VGHQCQYIIDKHVPTRYFDRMNFDGIMPALKSLTKNDSMDNLVPREFVDLAITARLENMPVDCDIAKIMRDATKRSDKLHRDANKAVASIIETAINRSYERMATRKTKK